MGQWTNPDLVRRALGPSVGTDDYLDDCCDAANAAAFRKRREAGYTDDPDPDAPAPSPDVAMGATQWAVALWRERASTEGFSSFEDLAGFTPIGGSWGTIRRMLGIGRAGVDAPPSSADGTVLYGARWGRSWRR